MTGPSSSTPLEDSSPKKEGGEANHRRLLLVIVLVAIVLGGSAAMCWIHPWSRSARPLSAAEQWKRATQAAEARDFAAARTDLEAYLSNHPLSAKAHFLLARTCRRQGDDNGWRDHLTRAEALQWPAEAIALEKRLAQAQHGNIWAVERDLYADLQTDPDDEIVVLEALVQGLLENDRLTDVLHWTDWWHRRHPDDWLAWLYHGEARQRARSSEAIDDYTRVLQAKPNYLPALRLRAAALATAGHFQDALRDYHACLAQTPADPGTLFGIAHCEQSLGHADTARAAVDALLRQEPNNAAALLVRAKLDLDDDPARALQRLLRAEKLAPNEIDIVQNLTLAYRLLHDSAKAAAYDRRYREIQQQSDRLSNLLLKIRQQPSDAKLRCQAGEINLRLDHKDEAIHWFLTAVRIDPKNRSAHAALADLFAAKGDKERAAYYRARAVSGSP
jgi:tetratricopeptide (TPR) repeat protein